MVSVKNALSALPKSITAAFSVVLVSEPIFEDQVDNDDCGFNKIKAICSPHKEGYIHAGGPNDGVWRIYGLPMLRAGGKVGDRFNTMEVISYSGMKEACAAQVVEIVEGGIVKYKCRLFVYPLSATERMELSQEGADMLEKASRYEM